MHSPGPWTVFNNGNNFFQVQSAAVGKGYYSTIGSFCQRDNHPEHGGRINTETAKANAQLAAAAPDLLALLKEWDEPGACGCDTAMCRGTCLPARTRDAIAKATGERS